MSSTFETERKTGTTTRIASSRAQKKGCRQTMDPPHDRQLCLRQAIGNQSSQAGHIQTKPGPGGGETSISGKNPKLAGEGMQTPGPGQADTNSCAGWERDRESFAKVVADNYVSSELGIPAPRAMKIWCADPAKSPLCEVYYEKITVMVSFKFIPGYVVARKVRPLGPRCEYTYSCNAQNTLEITKRKCG
ncbi:MAG: hypothetical protein WC291_02310 [Thermodesulfovibrionales bacterium]|jgi:hypothetical protein